MSYIDEPFRYNKVKPPAIICNRGKPHERAMICPSQTTQHLRSNFLLIVYIKVLITPKDHSSQLQLSEVIPTVLCWPAPAPQMTSCIWLSLYPWPWQVNTTSDNFTGLALSRKCIVIIISEFYNHMLRIKIILKITYCTKNCSTYLVFFIFKMGHLGTMGLNPLQLFTT